MSPVALKESPSASPVAAQEPRSRLLRYLASMGFALLLATGASFTALYERAEWGLRDLQMRLWSPVGRYADVLVVDVNEDAMRALESQVGAWPYPRQIYALVGAYLERSEARAVVYDVLFAEAREGDPEFAAALRDRPVVLAAAALGNSIERSALYRQRLGALGWQVPAEVPRRRWPDVTLPAEALGADQVGLVTLQPDADGHVRRLPLFHEAEGAVLPALSLAGLHAAGSRPAVAYEDGRVRVGDRSWPVNASGDVVLKFPSRVAHLDVLPFHELVLAALGQPGFAKVADRIRGRTVVLGSSAERLGDYVQTPLGRLQGVAVTAMAIALLDRGEVLSPPDWRSNGLLLLIALLVPALTFHWRLGHLGALPWLAAPLAVGLVLAVASVLFKQGQQTAMLFPILVSLAALVADLFGRVLALQRIRQRLAAEKLAAERASELKSQFMSHMTHELRTPLTGILGFNQRLSAPGLDEAARARYVDVVEKNGRHLLQLINNILDGAKLEAGQMKIVPVPTRVRDLAGDVVQTLAPQAEGKGIALELAVADRVPALVALDPLRMKQVLLNLCGNAVKFTEAGRVALRIDWTNATLVAEIEDTGPGMDEAQLARIFIPFQQAHDRVAQKHGGTGLGLSISRNLCELMGGALQVRSQPGKGSVFEVRVAAPEAVDPAPPAPLRRPVAAGRLEGTVLVVDDSEDLRDLVGLYLGDLGLEVRMAGDGAEALEAVRAAPPDAVLTDMEMPRMNGMQLAAALRADGYRAPIVLLTAHPEGGETEKAMQAGCSAYVGKPVDPAALKQTLRRVMEQR